MKMIFTFLMLLPAFAEAALVDPALGRFTKMNTGSAKVLVLMTVNSNRPLPLRQDARSIARFLREQTNVTFTNLQQGLQPAISKGDIQIQSVFSINQSFSALVSPAGLRALAKNAGVTKIYLDGKINYAQPISRKRVFARLAGEIPYDLTILGLDELAKSHPQLNGNGVLVGHIDTGVDGKHPAVAGKIAVFFDADSGKVGEPKDSDQHGTHTAGTIVGAPRDGIPMGVAPGSKLVSAGALSGYSEMLKAMEFMLNPDGNAETINDIPKLVSNSWNCEGAPDVELFYRAINTWEAAGILSVFSAGNSGPRPQSITKPHEHPDVLAVAAFGPGGTIAGFSSRGPGIFNGQKTFKPDVGAPGVDIVSAVPGGGYEAMSGTSMAAPHAAGVAALLYQIDPTLTPAKMREILVKSSNYVDESGKDIPTMTWNPAHGYGRMNAVKAVALVESMRGMRANRWGSMMSPSVGFGKMAPLSPAIGRGGPATELQRKFLTDSRRWINGLTL